MSTQRAFMAILLRAITTVGCTPLRQPAAATVTTAAPSAASTVSAIGIQGAWTGQYESTKYNTINGTISVASDCVSQGTVSGALTGSTISFGAVKAEQTVTFDGVLSGNTLRGNYHSGPVCGSDAGTWTATRL